MGSYFPQGNLSEVDLTRHVFCNSFLLMSQEWTRNYNEIYSSFFVQASLSNSRLHGGADEKCL